MAGQEYNLKTILSVVDKLSPTLKNISKSYGTLTKRVQLVGRAAANAGREFQSFVSGALAPGMIALGALGLSIGGSAKAFAAYAATLSDVATRVGVTTDALQKLRYAAATNGSSAETMDSALIKLNQTLYDASTGSNKDAAALFKTLGISIKDASGNVRNASEIFPQLTEAFRLNENAAVRTKMAIALFGKAGADLLPLLAQGADGLKTSSDRAREFGMIVSDDVVAAGAAMDGAFNELGMSLNATVGVIAASLMPVVRDMIEVFMRWTAENREIIAQNLAGWVSDVVSAIQSIDWGWVAIALEAVFGGAMVVKLGKFAVAVAQVGIAIATSLGPVGLAITAVAAAFAAAAYEIYRNWDDIAGWLKKQLDAAKAIFDQAAATIRSVWAGALDWIQGKIDAVVGAIGKAFSAMSGALPDWLVGWFKSSGAQAIKIDAPGALESPGRAVARSALLPSDDSGGRADVLAPNLGAAAVQGSVRGTVDINVHSDDGRTETVKAPINGAVFVGGDPGLMREGF